MFFPRLRRQVKWMFVLLALVFGVGYVIFGVGGSGTGLGDVLNSGGSATGGAPSVSDALKKVEANPKDAQALRALATAYETDAQTNEAIDTLESYAALRPKDISALQELAGLYMGQASRRQQEAQEAQYVGSFDASNTVFSEPLQLGGGQSLGEDPITQAVSTKTNDAITSAYTAAASAISKAQSTYVKLAAASPKDAGIQLQLAQTAQQSGDTKVAIAAYERFLKLAPDDPSAPLVKQQLVQLKTPPATGATG